MTEQQKKKNKKKTKTALMATTAAASLIVNNTYDTVSDVINTEHQEDNIREFEQQRELSLKEKIANSLNSIPLVLRMLILVPLWFIGYGLMLLINPLLTLLSGIANDLLCFAILLGVVLLIILIAGKFIFPDLPLKERFNKKTIFWSAVSVAVIIVLDKIASHYSEEYYRYSYMTRYIASMTLTVGWAIIIAVKIGRKPRRTVVTASTDKYTVTETN